MKKTRINEVLKEKKISQTKLGQMMGVSTSAINQMIHGNPTKETLQKIADAIGVNLSILIDDAPNECDNEICIASRDLRPDQRSAVLVFITMLKSGGGGETVSRSVK